MSTKIGIKAIYDRDSKSFHRYLIDSEGIKGSLYIPKGKDIPTEIRVCLRTHGEDEKEKALESPQRTNRVSYKGFKLKGDLSKRG
jgi:hypothetical protein